jgi:IMP dehydrogenase
MLRIAQEALTFDDVLLVPAHSKVLPHTADLKTKLTRKINLNVPMVSASMDTVTEARLAITLAQEGGLGFIHKNMTIAEQASNVSQVKKYESGIVSDPVTVSVDFSIEQVMKKADELGFSGFPVVDDKHNLVGIITGRDLRFETDLTRSVSSLMTAKADLVTVKEGAAREEILGLMHSNRIEKILVVDEAFKLVA